jgi:hypothetical protein
MERKNRLALFKKLAQSAAPTVIAGTLRPASANLEGYWSALSSIIPNLNVALLTSNDWIYAARIIGVIDQVLVALTNKKMNFYSVTTTAPTSTTGSGPINALILAAKNLKNKFTVNQKVPYTAQQIRSLITDPLRRDLATRLDNVELPKNTGFNAIQGSPGEALRREITNWQK